MIFSYLIIFLKKIFKENIFTINKWQHESILIDENEQVENLKEEVENEQVENLKEEEVENEEVVDVLKNVGKDIKEYQEKVAVKVVVQKHNFIL